MAQAIPAERQFALHYTINIGDRRSQVLIDADKEAGAPLALRGDVLWREARVALRAVGFLIKTYQHKASVASEGTHVVELDASQIPAGEVFSRLYGVAKALHQDCIAVRVRDWTRGNPVLHETLVGPRRDAWWPFNPEFFVEVAHADTRSTAAA